jgi:hypothetical protein
MRYCDESSQTKFLGVRIITFILELYTKKCKFNSVAFKQDNALKTFIKMILRRNEKIEYLGSD